MAKKNCSGKMPPKMADKMFGKQTKSKAPAKKAPKAPAKKGKPTKSR